MRINLRFTLSAIGVVLLSVAASIWLQLRAQQTSGVQSSSQPVQVTGTPGSPDATTTITGEQLPPPPPKFGGVIKESYKDSKPWWPPRVVPPKGAPNVLLIMTDDQGYGVPSTFGGVIPTPALDRIAKAGLRYTNFSSTALCSAHAGGLDHRPQPPFGGLRRDHRALDRLPGL